jgi:hypothetical protein
VTSSAAVGSVSVDQFVATSQSPLTGFFQLTAVMSYLSFQRFLVGDECVGRIDQNLQKKRAQPTSVIGSAGIPPATGKTDLFFCELDFCRSLAMSTVPKVGMASCMFFDIQL